MVAKRKSVNLLPKTFQTDTNRKFLSATLDQLISEPNLINVNGYIGRKFSPTFKITDSYVNETTAERQNYQLEPSVVVKNDDNEIGFFSGYQDLINKIKHYGGVTDNHDRLFENEFYSYDPAISFDKFVNFSQYYWLTDGPDAVDVNTGGVAMKDDFIVTRNLPAKRYDYNADGKIVNTIVLARGGTYTFTVDQPDVPFWIQSEPGIDGRLNATPTISSRAVAGVTNNGDDVGVITFEVPQKELHLRYVNMPTVYQVDYAVPLAYADLHNNLLSVLVENFPQYATTAATLDGKHIIFIGESAHTSRGEEAWTARGVYDLDGLQVTSYDEGDIVPSNKRYGVWKIIFVPSGIEGNPILRLLWVQDVNFEEKVYIRYGILNANKEFYKENTGFFVEVPLLSALQDELYVQDGAQRGLYTRIKIVDPVTSQIDVVNDILGRPRYTSPNGVIFTSGLKISFAEDVTPAVYQNKTYYVENVGEAINLVDVELLVTPEKYREELATQYPDQVFPEYITIKRDATDLNSWSRNNRWFHIDIITKTAEYNNTEPIYDQTLRAQRPIVQFEGNYQLYNFGRVGLPPLDALDATSLDPFNDFEGKILDTAFGIPLFDGLRVLFAIAEDPEVRGKIYLVRLVQYDADPVTGLPVGPYYVKLELDSQYSERFLQPYDTTVVLKGQFKGSGWWYDGQNWRTAQEKTKLQQSPLFDVYDTNNKSLSSYTNSTFRGTKLFGYLESESGAVDPVLGFALKYRNFGTQGDIEFKNYFDSDTFTFDLDGRSTDALKVGESGFLVKIIDRDTTVPRNTWRNVVESSKQYQIFNFIYNIPENFIRGENSQAFAVDVVPNAANNIPHVKVYRNSKFLTEGLFSVNGSTIIINETLAINDRIDILVYSDTVSKIGYYEIPSNLELNAENIDIDTFTLGQLRNHLVALSQNSLDLDRPVLGPNNLRDLEIKQQGGTILQHSSPVPYSSIFLLNDRVNFINSLKFAQSEYTKFKNKFLELSTTLPGIDPTDPATTIDLLLNQINNIKNITFPWFYSDMVPYGKLTNTIEYVIFDPLVKSYEISQIFDDTALSNRAVLVYRNSIQLIKDIDYTFDKTRPAITFKDIVPLAVDDVIKIVEYENTDGNYIPETPTKLGLYPKYVPEIILDDTYRNPISVIIGHDGSVTPSFNDYRDQLLLELEKRIYNNIKLPTDVSFGDIWVVLPGKFRRNNYNRDEVIRLLSTNFLSWVGTNKVQFNINNTFKSNDEFTWNYSRFIDRLDDEIMPGSWRACYLYYYDTVRPHLTPWEMLGFSTKPDWWENYYGPAPYTGGNKLLWDDLEQGLVRFGPSAGIIEEFRRPGLSKIIPVDVYGNLQPPAAIIAKVTQSKYAANAWSVGDYGPTEWAWRTSSDFPFAVCQALALAKPAKFFGNKADLSTYRYNSVNQQFLTSTNLHHFAKTNLKVHGDNSGTAVTRTAGYVNYICDYLRNLGINPKIELDNLIGKYQVNLAYKVGGFTDKRYLRVLAEQSSPTSTNDSVLVPDENYQIHLYKSTPINKVIYSGVIVEKTDNGYSLTGYNTNDPFFTIIPSITNNNAYKISVLNLEGVIYREFQNLKLSVPYGYEFRTPQQVVDFLVSYERYLVAQGFVFDAYNDVLSEKKDWKLSAKEFLFWAQQGWRTGSLLFLSPFADEIKFFAEGVVVDKIDDSQYGTRVIDQDFNIIKNTEYDVLREDGEFKLNMAAGSTIGFLEINLVQNEHVMVFDNTTVFSDIIYKPELGNRQYRLKLIGQKTGDWDGSLYAPGFIFNKEKVPDWIQGRDYFRGDLVEYKNRYYVALQDTPGASDFNFNQWKQIDRTEIKTGLLPNFSTVASIGDFNYNSHAYFKDEKELRFSHSLIGYKPRQYLDDLGLDDTTQIELYKGYIKQKGTNNAILQLTKAEFNNLKSTISFYEEWAVRVGEYGALDINPYVEFVLDEKQFAVNPAVAEFVTDSDGSRGDGITVFNAQHLYRRSGAYTGTIALDRDGTSYYDQDIPTAGYVNIDDVDATLFDLTDFSELNRNLKDIGVGYTIWVAKDFTQDWNVFRISESNNFIVQIDNALDQLVTFTSSRPHGLQAGDVFLIKYFSDNVDGFYQVSSVLSQYKITVEYNGSAEYYSTLLSDVGQGVLFKLLSMRFQYMEDAREFGLSAPLNYWKEGDKIWIDVDAATTVAQGQSADTPTRTWKVYEKTVPWENAQRLQKQLNEYASNDGFGTALKISDNALYAVAGSPFANVYINGNLTTTGHVITFNRTKNLGTGQEQFIQGDTVIPTAKSNANIIAREFGTSVDLAVEYLAVGAPASTVQNTANVGMVHVYHRPEGTLRYETHQVLVGNLVEGGRYGESLAYDEFGDWLYVGAPSSSKVYIYGLNKNIREITQHISVNEQKTITLSAPVTANIGDTVRQFVYNTVSNIGVTIEATVLANVTSSITIVVRDPIGLRNGSVIGVETIGNVNIIPLRDPGYAVITDTGANIVSNTVSATISTVTLNFTPDLVTSSPGNIAHSLYITDYSRVYIPEIDYTVSGSVVTFISGGLPTGDYLIKQRPYYQLVDVLQGPAGSEFGYALDASLDGAQLAVGAPNDTVNVATRVDGVKVSVPLGTATASVVSYEELQGAGSVYVYDRIIEAFIATDAVEYTTTYPIGLITKVTKDSVEVTNYTIPGGIGTNTIRFDRPPTKGQTIYIETNKYNLLEKLIGVDSLEGGLDAIQEDARFGTDLTICSNNCAIYVGAPNYDYGANYNIGAVWKFHNKGRLYGTNRGFLKNPTFEPNDSIRLDNFEVKTSLKLNGNITAAAGSFITQVVGTGIANVQILEDTAATGQSLIKISDYLDANVFVTGGANISINGTGQPVKPVKSTLDDFVLDINTAGILGVTASNENNYLRIKSSSTVDKNLLRTLSGRNVSSNPTGISNIYDYAGMAVFAFMQIIVTPYSNSGEHFGNRVVLARNAYMLVIGTDRGTTRHLTTFDSKTTVFDDGSTEIFDAVLGSGSVYVYELYDDPRDMVEHPGRYAFAQQLNPGDLNTGDRFGADVDVSGDYILTSAPTDDTVTYFTFNSNVTVTNGDIITQPDNNLSRYEVVVGEVNNNTVLVKPTRNHRPDTGSSALVYINGVATSNFITNIKEDTGSVYIFHNTQRKRGWNLLRYQEAKVDIDSVNRIFLYNKLNNIIQTNVEFIDPAKGKILGIAEQEISYKTSYDPAYYNKGNGQRTNISENLYWGPNQLGQIWWNLDKARFIDYEQGSTIYRGANWGRLFPGSIIEICEWVESSVPPSQHAAQGLEGRPVYQDDSAYVEIVYVDPQTNIIGSKYYYWVTDKNSVEINNPSRKLPINVIRDLIFSPKAQNIPYAALLSKNTLAFYNIKNYLSANNVICHIDYEVLKNNSIIHSEYECIQSGNPDSFIPEKLSNKLVDSLAGQDNLGRAVPDPFISPYDRYGINVRPRQSMFVDRGAALKNLVEYVNDIFIKYPIIREYEIPYFLSEEPLPRPGTYDLLLNSQSELELVDINSVPVGYKVLVKVDTTQDNLWVVYELTSARNWQIFKTQSYKTQLYWEYVDWYEPGFDATEIIEYVVDTLVDALKLPVTPGDEVLVRVNTGVVTTGWNLLTVQEDGTYRVVGIENGTLQIKDNIYNFKDNKLGFGNQLYDTNRFDQNPGVEIRNVLLGLKEDIFTRQLEGEWNKLFFVMVNYLFNEQKYVDWIFKTSFISVSHKLRALDQYPNFVKDNQTYYLDYINEVKPYATKVREYSVNYDGNDVFGGDITDFDLAPYYDRAMDTFRSPSGEQIDKDRQLWATGYLGNTLINVDYPSWYQNKDLKLTEIIVEDAGEGYLIEPSITILGGGNTVTRQATATATIDFDTGEILSIDLTDPGEGYSLTPTVIINGGSSRPARAYPVLVNQQVRTFDTALRFDRIAYESAVKPWEPNTFYQETEITFINGKEYWSGGDIITHVVPDGNRLIRQAYIVNANVITGSSFNPDLFTVYPAANFASAGDRILAYYEPTGSMPGRDLKQLLTGLEYPGVEVQGLPFAEQPGFSGYYTANITFSGPITVYPGNIIIQPEADGLLHTSMPITANIGQFITQATGANGTVYGNTITHGVNNGNLLGVLGNVVNDTSVYIVRNSTVEFDANSNIFIGGVEQVISTWGNVQQVTIGNVLYTTNTAPYGWSNVGIRPITSNIGGIEYVEIPIVDANLTVTKVWAPNKVQGTISTTQAFITGNTSITNGNIMVGTTWQNANITRIDYISVSTASSYDAFGFDSIDTDEDGNPILGEETFDTIIRSQFTDSALGIRPEDINIDGGEYVDVYSSHAPEELVPGIIYDTLDIKVFQNGIGTAINAFKIFTRNFQYTATASTSTCFSETTYLRLCDDFATTLAEPLLLADTVIHVIDASVLPEPSPENSEPGVIFIGAERITYFERDLGNNTLSRIRRGTKGTAARSLHQLGAIVYDGSLNQLIPGTTYANVTISNASNVNVAASTSFTSIINNTFGNGLPDGTGLDASTTAAGEFIKACSARNILGLVLSRAISTEDAVNTISTESGDDDLYEEDF